MTNTKTTEITNITETTKSMEIRTANIAELKGRLSAAREMGKATAIIKMPVYLLAIDERYQTPIRTSRQLSYLTDNWDENKLLPLQGVPHDEEGKIYLTDGYGRWKASQIVDKAKYTSLEVLVILNAPTDPQERLRFEAEQFAFQNKYVAPLKPIQKHGAMEILGDTSVLALNEFKAKYGFEYNYSRGSKRQNTLGSYSEALNIIKTKGTDCMNYIFAIIVKAGFDRKSNGYSRQILRALKDAYCLYTNDKTEVKRFLISILRSISPRNLNAEAVAKYPMLAPGSALSLYIEDLIVNNLHIEQSREIVGSRIRPIKKKKTA